MAKRNFGDEFGFQTRAVHTGNDVDSETGAIKRPITMANSYELPYDPSDLNWSSAGKTSTHATAVQISSIFRKSLRPLRAERIALFLQAVLRLCRDFSLHCSKAVTMLYFQV